MAIHSAINDAAMLKDFFSDNPDIGITARDVDFLLNLELDEITASAYNLKHNPQVLNFYDVAVSLSGRFCSERDSLFLFNEY